MTDNPRVDRSHRTPVKWVLEGRHNRQEPFARMQDIPTNLVDKYKQDVDKINTTQGFRRYRVVSR